MSAMARTSPPRSATPPPYPPDLPAAQQWAKFLNKVDDMFPGDEATHVVPLESQVGPVGAQAGGYARGGASEPTAKKRVASDGCQYTKDEFLDHYGSIDGERFWQEAGADASRCAPIGVFPDAVCGDAPEPEEVSEAPTIADAPQPGMDAWEPFLTQLLRMKGRGLQ